MAEKTLRFRIGADIDEALDALRDLQAASRKIGRDLQDLGRDLTLGITVPLTAAAGAALKLAADAQEAENLFAVAMGEMAEEARTFSDSMAGALGLDPVAVRQTMGTFRAMFDAMGIGEGAATELSKGLAQLEADWTSFYNLADGRGLEILQSAISGEIEPVRRLGFDLSAAAVEAYAFEAGIAAAGTELTQGQKILARYGLLVEQSEKSIGDKARTMDSFTNVTRTAMNEVKTLAREFGEDLIPSATDAVNSFRDLIDVVRDAYNWFRDLDPAIQEVAVTLVAVTAAVGPLSVAVGTLMTLFGGFSATAATLTGILGGIAFIAVTLAQNWQEFGVVVLEVWQNVKQAVLAEALAMVQGLADAFGFLPVIGSRLRAAAGNLEDFLAKEKREDAQEMEWALLDLAATLSGQESAANAAADAWRELRAEIDLARAGAELAGDGSGAAGAAEAAVRPWRETLAALELDAREIRVGVEGNVRQMSGLLYDSLIPSLEEWGPQFVAAYEGVLGNATDSTENELGRMKQTVVASFGAMAQAAIRGSADMAQSVISAMTQILQSIPEIAGGLGGLGGTLVGALGGIVGALFAERRRPQPVRIEDYSSRALSQMRQPSGPERVVIQLLGGDGRTIEEIQYGIQRNERRDRVIRFPTAAPAPAGG